jgi:hypothetical protein
MTHTITSYLFNVHRTGEYIYHQHQEKNYWKNSIKNSLQILLFLVPVLLFSQKLTGSKILNPTKIKEDFFSSHLGYTAICLDFPPPIAINVTFPASPAWKLKVRVRCEKLSLAHHIRKSSDFTEPTFSINNSFN